MGRPNFECGSCPRNLAYGEPETTVEQNHAILRYCLDCPYGDQKPEDKIASALHKVFKSDTLDPRLYYKAAEALIASGITFLPAMVGQSLWVIRDNKRWDFESKTWVITSHEVHEVKVSMIQQKVDGTWKVRISTGGSVYDEPAADLNEFNGYYFTKAAAERAVKEDYDETV